MTVSTERAVLAGGCFWGVQDLLRRYPGVISTRVGYTGGEVSNATYRNHGNHAEGVEIIFDPKIISYRKLLEFFFQIHDPSTLNRQGNDRGASYRSAIFYTNEEQKRIAEDTIADVDASGLWPGKVVTEVAPAGPFWEAEPEHQDYLERYPDGYTCHFIRPEWTLPHRADKAEPGVRGSCVTKGSDLLVAALENEGLEYIFAIPGEENLDVLESLRRSRIKLVLTRHEQAAGFMAATYGRLTGRAGVCLTTLGPGALNLTTAAAYAYLGAMPMVMITGQKAIRSSRQARFQIVDTVATMRPLTKMATQIVAAQSIPTLVRDAFRVAQQERPGPVHLELPEDIAADQAAADMVPPHTVELSVAPSAAIDRAAAMIVAARKPLVMLGAAASRPQLAEPLSAFVRRCRIPFFNTQMGKGAVNAGSNLYMGTAALSERDWVHEAIDQADLIISIGHDTVEKPPFLMGHHGPQVIHVGAMPATVEQVYFPQAEIVGDVGTGLAALADRLEGKLPNAAALLGLREGILARLAERSTEDRFPLTPQRIVHDVRSVIPPDGIVALDNGMYKIWFARNYRTSVANTLLLDNALATMGAGFPSAIGAALIHPGRRVLAVCGDGGFMMNSQELETAVRLKLNLVVLVLEDRAYGMIRWKQEVDGFPDFGLEFGNPDFVAYAKSYGAKGARVGKASELSTMLGSAFTEGGVHLVVAPVDYSENMRVLVNELPPVIQAK